MTPKRLAEIEALLDNAWEDTTLQGECAELIAALRAVLDENTPPG